MEKKYKWFSGYNTKKEAEKALVSIINDLNNNTYVDTSKIRVDEYLNNWIKIYGEMNLEKTTLKGYRIYIEKYIIPRIGNIELQKLKPFHIQNMYSDLLNNGRTQREGGLSNKTVLQAHRILRKALKQAYKMQMISINIADLVEPPRKKTFVASYLKDDEIQPFLIAFKNTDLYLAVLLAIGLGLRRGEILGLRWDDIDFNNNTVSINQTLVRANKENVFSSPKTDKSRRTIVIS